MLSELLMLALNNLGRARARLAMTSGGVVVGTTAVVILIALTIGLQGAAEAGIGSSSALTEIQVYPNYDTFHAGTAPTDLPTLSPKAVEQFWQIPGVAAVIPMTYLQGGELKSGRYLGYAQIIGIDPALLPYLGVNIQWGEMRIGPNEVLSGQHVGDYFTDPNDNSGNFEPVEIDLTTANLQLRLYQYTGTMPGQDVHKLSVVGLIQEGSSYDYSMFLPLKDVLALNEWITGTKVDPKKFVFDQVTIRASSRETTVAVSEAVREMGYSAGGMGDYITQLNNFFTTMRLMLGGVGGVALLVAAFGVANTMTMAILERTREIGLMKAIGASDRDVLTVFLIESGLVGFVGGLVGVAVSYFLQKAINDSLSQAAVTGSNTVSFLPFDTSRLGGNLIVIPPELTAFALILATCVGLGAGLYPSLRAARMEPVLALKTE